MEKAMYRELVPQLTAEHLRLKDEAHDFAAKILRPAAARLERTTDPIQVAFESSPLWAVLRDAYRHGYHRATIAAEVGGLGLDGLAQHILFEELGWGAADLAISIAATAVPFTIAASTGNPELVDRFVRPFVEDTAARLVGCSAIADPGHGSDMLMVGTPQFHDPRIAGDLIARPDRSHYVLNGQKAAWVANGTIATHALTFVTLDPGRGMAGGGVAIVPLNLHGISHAKPLEKTGQRGLDQGAILFDEVRIPADWLITDPTLYQFVLERTLSLVHGAMSAIFTGVARAAYEEALAHCRGRVQGGKPICEHQLVQKRLYDMFTRVEAARALSRAVMVHNHATMPPATELAIVAKTFCTEAAFEVANDGLQLFGASAFRRGSQIERLFRDARAAQIEYGSNDVLALVAMRRLLDATSATRHGAA
jgi:alkylation response protein AidB-like acyl-CoA dehydrogenase